jgi:hypothetical protein
MPRFEALHRRCTEESPPAPHHRGHDLGSVHDEPARQQKKRRRETEKQDSRAERRSDQYLNEIAR